MQLEMSLTEAVYYDDMANSTPPRATSSSVDMAPPTGSSASSTEQQLVSNLIDGMDNQIRICRMCFTVLAT